MTHPKIDLEELRRLMLDWRDIQPGVECAECGGSGIKTYGSTATWRGGAGGAAITTDVCDHCWGSGNRYKPWPPHRDC